MVSSTLKSRAHTVTNRHRAQHLAWRWIRWKWPRLASEGMDVEGERLERSHADARLTVSSTKGAASWVAEIVEVARDARQWRTRIAVVDGNGNDILVVQAGCRQGTGGPARVAPPKLLGAWAEALEVHDAIEPAFGAPWWVDGGADVDAFVSHLSAAQRALPVITLASKGTSRYFGVDPEALAKSMHGMAHVACVTQDARQDLAARLGPRMAPVQGAARIYAPGFGRDEAPQDHPLVRQPAMRQPGDQAQPESFRLAVIRATCAVSARAAARAEAYDTTW